MYDHKKIEKRWQNYWYDNNVFKTPNQSGNKKFYVLDMFPYPSGSGLHVGHPEGYTASDVVARFKRLQAFDVLHPMGWDAFGLPAEQYAIQTGNHPGAFTQKNIRNFRNQLKTFGFSYDWEKEVDTTDPSFYKTTQWIFQQMYKRGLAKIEEINVNWCQELGTVLANEEVIQTTRGDVVSERGNFPVTKKPMKQWVLKITNYADKLFKDLDQLDWPSSLVKLQKNWIYPEDKILHLKDWVFSRQRYWGEPFPVYFNEKNDVFLVDKLPLSLPDLKRIKPAGDGRSPLANNKEWVNFKKNGQKMRRDTNTMPQWAGSSWYYLAYILKTKKGYLDIDSPKAYELFQKWLPVDLYIGGQEHAVLHLLYARFWHKVLYDLKVVPTQEPFYRVVNQGMILGPDGHKMSKSKGNIINPDEIINKYGADTIRIYEMFMGPLTETKVWSNQGIEGVRKWLEKVFKIFTGGKLTVDPNLEKDNLLPHYNLMVKKVTKYVEQLKFNVAVSQMMIFTNEVQRTKRTKTTKVAEGFLTVLSLFAPHLAEHLLRINKFKEIKDQKWPGYDKQNVFVPKPIMAIQVAGKMRGTVEIQSSWSKKRIIERAKLVPAVKKHLESKEIKKVIYVPNKIINFIL